VEGAALEQEAEMAASMTPVTTSNPAQVLALLADTEGPVVAS